MAALVCAMPHAVQRHFEDEPAELIGAGRMTSAGDRFDLEVAKQLLADRILSLTGLAEAMRRRGETGERLADAIISTGIMSADAYYRTVAVFYGLRFVDLDAEPADPAAVDDTSGFLEQGLLPWRREDGRLLIAASTIGPDHIEWADARFGDGAYDFVIVAPRQGAR